MTPQMRCQPLKKPFARKIRDPFTLSTESWAEEDLAQCKHGVDFVFGGGRGFHSFLLFSSYVAKRKSDKLVVAIKESILSSDNSRLNWLEEIQVMQMCKHKNIVHLIESFSDRVSAVISHCFSLMVLFKEQILHGDAVL